MSSNRHESLTRHLGSIAAIYFCTIEFAYSCTGEVHMRGASSKTRYRVGRHGKMASRLFCVFVHYFLVDIIIYFYRIVSEINQEINHILLLLYSTA